MLFEVERAQGMGTVLLAQFAPVDYRGAAFAAQVAWPAGGPGGDWWFRFALVDQSGRVWYTQETAPADPAAPAPETAWLIPYAVGPEALPTAWQDAFDAQQTTQIWFQVWTDPAAYPAQVFDVAIDWVQLGAPAFAAWSLATETLPATTRETLFGGLVSSVSMTDGGALDGTVTITYSCRDYQVFTDGRSWNKDYTAAGMTDAQIIREILTGTGLTPSILTAGAITETGVLSLNFSYQTVTQCLDAIANATGLVWTIAADGTLNYQAPPAAPPTLTLTDQAGGNAFRVDEYALDWYAPANDVTFFGDGVSAHVYDQASIDQYGLMQWLDYDLRITHADTALTAAESDLERAATPNERASITCWTVGAQPGTVILATAARYGWTAKALEVQTVKLTQLADSGATTEVVLTCGDYQPTLLAAMQAVAKEAAATTAAASDITVNGV
jgi:hypothetical protein